ncbi:MAG TPA: hypothetical protein VNE40_01020 [Candidatus Dormibacteraeota bacterium]|nr:hypothetical protein [Candidatus Dormibacteraeota bacterium]
MKNVNSIDLNFQGVTIGISGQDFLTSTTLANLESNITGLRVGKSFETIARGQIDFTPAATVSAKLIGEQALSITGQPHLFAGGIAIAHTAQYMSECIRPSVKDLFLVHAAAVVDPQDNSAIVLFGEKGAGKTTLAFRLCHEHGYVLVGNDQIFLGHDNERLYVEGGNNYFDIRTTAVRSDSYLGSVVLARSNNKPAWNDKLRVRAHDLGIASSTEYHTAKQLLHVRIDHTENSLKVAPWSGLQQTLVMHERIGRHISGQATPLLDDNGTYYGSLPSMLNQHGLAARDRIVSHIQTIGITEIFAPNAQAALEFITTEGKQQ